MSKSFQAAPLAYKPIQHSQPLLMVRGEVKSQILHKTKQEGTTKTFQFLTNK